MYSSLQRVFADESLVVLIPAAVEPHPRTDVADALHGRAFIADLMARRGHTIALLDITPNLLQSSDRMKNVLRSTGAHCIFNLFEGFGDDSTAEHAFREIVEEVDIPCTGNPSQVLLSCLSKEESARTLRNAGIPVPRGIALYPGFDRSILKQLRAPLFVKPLMEDASIGVDASSLVPATELLLRTVLEKLSLFPMGIRVEEFLTGQEFSAACIGNDPYKILGVSVIDYETLPHGLNFLDYDSKWNPNSPLYSLTPKRADGEIRERAAKLASAAGSALGCRGYFRVDMREQNGVLHVIDVNPNPDMTPGGGFLRQCRESGISEAEAVHSILGLALEEHLRRNIQ